MYLDSDMFVSFALISVYLLVVEEFLDLVQHRLHVRSIKQRGHETQNPSRNVFRNDHTRAWEAGKRKKLVKIHAPIEGVYI